MITGVVLARNEERNIAECLEALLPHVDELLLIDMESTDRTVEIAQPLVKKIIAHPLTKWFDGARNVAVDHARYDWIWFVDADERVPFRTGQLVRQLVQSRGNEISAITIPFKTYFCGTWIRHCGWWPGYTMPRVLKRGQFRFVDQLHGGVRFEGPELRIPPDPELGIDHFSYRSIGHYVEKFNRYTDREAEVLRDQGQGLSWEAAIRAMVRDLWQYYEREAGKLDGLHGWILSWLAGQYRWFSHAKLLDLTNASPELAEGPPSIDAALEVMQSELRRLRSVAPRLPLGIVWRSPLFDPSGYAEDGRTLLKCIAGSGRSVAAEEIRWSQAKASLPDSDSVLLNALCSAQRPKQFATITNCIPSLSRPDPEASLNILRTTFETDRIPQEWLRVLDEFDEIWVPCRHNLRSFRQGGAAPERLRVLPACVDTRLFTPEGTRAGIPEALRGRFIFLSIFDWQLRKGWDILLRAYSQEFSPEDGVGLLLKISRSHGHELESIVKQADAILGEVSQTLASRPDILLWDSLLSGEQMAALYRAADCFVLLSRGEGWGRPYMEAMACGLPTIGTRGTGQLEFMDDRNSILISAKPEPIPAAAAAEIPVYAGHHWLEPDAEEFRAAMRDVFQNEQRRTSLGKNAASDIARQFSLEQAQAALEQNLQAAESRFQIAPPLPPSSDQLRVVLEGEFFAGHSFSNVNEQLAIRLKDDPSVALRLRRLRYNPTHDRKSPHAGLLSPYFGRDLDGVPAITIRHAFPPNWTPPAEGKWVHIQPWEFGALPLDWVEPLHSQIDEIWVPSTFVKQIYERSGIPGEKVHVLPWGVEPRIYNPDAPPRLLGTEGKFVFLFVGGTIPRKGFDLLLEAYRAEFSENEDVCLVVKDVGTQSFYRYGNYRESVLEYARTGCGPQVIYLENEMTEGQLASLYTACDCLVAPYRGEGFGLPILEAMACGLPPIVPQNGASDDFVTDEVGFRVPAEVVECEHEWRLCGVATELSIRIEDLRAAMREAFEHAERTRQMGALASSRAREKFSWDATLSRMLQRLKALAGPTADPVRRSAQPGDKAQQRWPTLSACMLAHNSEKTIGRSLSSVKPFVNEIIVVDLESEDRSAAIAEQYGARVYRTAWKQDYSQARNRALARATSDWILSIDADESMGDIDMLHLRRIISEVPADVLAVELKGPNAAADEDDLSREIRLFRNRNEITYRYRCFEQVQESVSRVGGRLAASNLQIRRIPSGSQCLVRLENDLLRLLHLDRLQQPDDLYVLYSLATAHYRAGNYFHAECYYQECLARCSPQRSEYGRALVQTVRCHLRKGDLPRAIESFEEASKRIAWDHPLRAVLQNMDRELQAQRTGQQPQFASHEGGNSDHLLRLYLGAGLNNLPGYTHVDIQPGARIEVVHDLNLLPWPWADNSVDAIVAEDVVEHLELNAVAFCNEAWRILKPGGELFIRTPHHNGDSSWIDPTHRWHLNEKSLLYLDPDSYWGATYPQYSDRKWRVTSLGVRGPQNIHAVMLPRKSRAEAEWRTQPMRFGERAAN